MARRSKIKPTSGKISRPPVSPVLSPARYPLLDMARGTAIILMVAYHFCYDLVFFHFAAFDLLGNPFWLVSRDVILTLFLGIVGVSLHLATRQGIRYPAFLRRLAWLALCAGLVTLASLWLFPQRYIFFGVLHFIALAGVLGLIFVRFDHANLGVGLILLAAGNMLQHPFFDQAAWQWLGLVTRKPATEDYVPLLPWFGVVLCGLWAGRRLTERDWLARAPGTNRWTRALAWLGRHSLWVYMLHQPILFGGFWLAAQAVR